MPLFSSWEIGVVTLSNSLIINLIVLCRKSIAGMFSAATVLELRKEFQQKKKFSMYEMKKWNFPRPGGSDAGEKIIVTREHSWDLLMKRAGGRNVLCAASEFTVSRRL